MLAPDLEDLRPDIRLKISAVLERLTARGFVPRLSEVRRTRERAAWNKAHGVSKAGTASLHVGDPGHVRAADIVDGRRDSAGLLILWGGSLTGTPDARRLERQTSAREFFAALGEEAIRAGLTWGGSWGWDSAHVESP